MTIATTCHGAALSTRCWELGAATGAVVSPGVEKGGQTRSAHTAPTRGPDRGCLQQLTRRSRDWLRASAPPPPRSNASLFPCHQGSSAMAATLRRLPARAPESLWLFSACPALSIERAAVLQLPSAATLRPRRPASRSTLHSSALLCSPLLSLSLLSALPLRCLSPTHHGALTLATRHCVVCSHSVFTH